MGAVLLLKIKILFDMHALDRTAGVGTKVLQEVLDEIRARTPSTTIVRENKALVNFKDHKDVIQKLDKQINDLIKWTNASNQSFLPTMIEPKHYLTLRPQAYSHGIPEQMQLALQYSYDSWT
jgi:hypothetical protein